VSYCISGLVSEIEYQTKIDECWSEKEKDGAVELERVMAKRELFGFEHLAL
jgi:hypothetical protein